MSENNFECFVSTGVNSRRTVFPNSALARLNPSAAFAPRNPSRRLIEVGVLKRWTVARIATMNLMLSLDKILNGSEINSLRDILRPAFCYEFVPCSISCGFGLACSFGWFVLA
jgi:hypothetical protein